MVISSHASLWKNEEACADEPLADLPTSLMHNWVTSPLLHQSLAQSDYHGWVSQLWFAHEAWKSLASSQDKGHQIPEQNQNLVSVGEAGQWHECGQLTVTSCSNFLVIPLIWGRKYLVMKAVFFLTLTHYVYILLISLSSLK